MTTPPSAAQPCAAASRARVSHHTSCCSQLWPARRLERCAGFLCSGCGRTMQSSAWTSAVAPLASSCAVSGVPQRTPLARDLSLLSPRRTVAPTFLVSPPQPKCSLKYTPPPFLSSPIDTPTLSPFPILPLARSLADNGIGAEGASALAAILKETQITTLKCAAAPECSLLCQRPLTHLRTHFPSTPLHAFPPASRMGAHFLPL